MLPFAAAGLFEILFAATLAVPLPDDSAWGFESSGAVGLGGRGAVDAVALDDKAGRVSNRARRGQQAGSPGPTMPVEGRREDSPSGVIAPGHRKPPVRRRCPQAARDRENGVLPLLSSGTHPGTRTYQRQKGKHSESLPFRCFTYTCWFRATIAPNRTLVVTPPFAGRTNRRLPAARSPRSSPSASSPMKARPE